MSKIVWLFVVGMLAFHVFASSAFAEKRIAFVVGNDVYKNLSSDQQLKKARNDARAVARTLEGLGFKVTLGLDVSRFKLNQSLDVFASQIEPGDTATVFFAGHGVRIKGRNYLLPADVPDMSRGSQDLLASESIAVDRITDIIKEKGARIAMLILDACRNNPFKNNKGRSVGGTRGLARMEPPEGTFILFSAGAGQEALDRLSDGDPNPNSVFTRSLIPLLKQEGLEVARMARLLRQKVKQLAATVSHTQTPALYNEVTGDFYILPSRPGAQVITSAKPLKPLLSAPASRPRLSEAAQAWGLIKNANDKEMLEAFIDKFGTSFYATLAKARLKAISTTKLAAVRPVGKVIRHARSPAIKNCQRRKFDLASAQICVSSVLSSQKGNGYGAGNLFDGNLSTAWVEGVKGLGVGESILIEFDRPTAVRSLQIVNGYNKNKALFAKNSRVGTFEIVNSAGRRIEVPLQDRMGWQEIVLSGQGRVKWLQLRIKHARAGSKYNDTAISELRLK